MTAVGPGLIMEAMVSPSGATFTPDKRAAYLNEMRIHGKKHLAAEAAGVSLEVIQGYRKNYDTDKQFASAEALCLALRSEYITQRLENEFIEGIMEPKVDKDGNLLYWNKPTGRTNPDGSAETVRTPLMTRRVESAARLRVLERHDPAYREHKEIDVNSKGGVLIVPQVANNIQDWQAAVEAAKAGV